MRKRLLNGLMILISGIIVNMILILLVFSLPTDRMKDNVRQSLNTFEIEGTYYELIKGYIGSRLDNFTDAVMLTNVVIDEGKSTTDRAMNVYRVSYEGKSPDESLISYVKGEDGKRTYPYTRYWSGYLVILKPLFIFFNYSQIRLINMTMQIALIVGVVIMLIKKSMTKYVIPLFVSYIYLCPITIELSLQFSSVFYITFLSVLIILLKHEKIEERNTYYIFFLLIGMLTSFFDLLTYPLVTLGIPLIFYFIMQRTWNIKESIIRLFELCFSWGVGYAGMWAGKWLVASLLVGGGGNVFKDAYNAILIRTSTETSTEKISYISVIMKNCNVMLFKPLFIVIICLIIILSIWQIFKKKKNDYKIMLVIMIPFVVIVIMPFIWYIALSNHSYIHFWFTYRILVICVFSVLSMFLKLMDAG